MRTLTSITQREPEAVVLPSALDVPLEQADINPPLAELNLPEAKPHSVTVESEPVTTHADPPYIRKSPPRWEAEWDVGFWLDGC